MDLSRVDVGCISLSDEKQTTDVFAESQSAERCESLSASVKIGKNKSSKDSPPSAGNTLNRITSQIKKPPHRKTSLNWFPRKKVDSYLKRKIKLLQEAGGMNDTLDETLGHSNPHYCRVEREKIAAREAACKVMEARKAAMVEASWCRILQAARIPSKEAEALLLKAEKEVTEAFEAAKSKGVMMYDTPDHDWKHFEIETSSVSGKGSTTHTVKASFETAFEVDKQVAAAVKTAFIRLAHCSSFNKDEFKDLLRKISENPDTHELSEFEKETQDDDCNSQRRQRKKMSPQKVNGTKLVDMMLERLKWLKEDELASLATIVATCGLNAALADTESHNRVQENISTTYMDYFMKGATRKKQVEPEFPSLDKFLVKKMTKLEKEVLEARKNARETKSDRDGEEIPDNNSHKHGKTRALKQEDSEIPSLDKFLVKHVSRLEREVQEAKTRRREIDVIPKGGHLSVSTSSGEEQVEKENVDLNRLLPLTHCAQNSGEVIVEAQNGEGNGKFEQEISLENMLEKPIHRLEREKAQEKEGEKWRYLKQQGKTNHADCESSLESVLVKHVSRLEKEKMRLGTKEVLEIKKKKDTTPNLDTSVGGLDQILVKPKSRLEREKIVASQQPEDGITYSSMLSRREARERELFEMWGGISFGNSMRPHVSRLERDKAAWVKAEEQEKRAALQEQ